MARNEGTAQAEIKKACAFDLDARCAAVSPKFCPGCRFYQTGEQLKESRERAYERVRTLPSEHQLSIAGKYYNNKTPWLQGRERRSHHGTTKN